MKNFSKDIKLLIVAQATSLVGGAILNFTLALFVLELTGAVEVFSTILAAAALPTALLGPMGGVIADRLDKKKMIILLDFCKGIIGLGMVTILFLGIEPVVWLAVLMLFMSLSMTLYSPIITASIPALIDDEGLISANGAIQGINAISEFIAPVVAGFLMIQLPVEPILLLGVALFWGSALMELLINIPYQKVQRNAGVVTTVLADLKEGFVYIIKENPKLLRLALSAAFAGAIVNPLFMVGIPYVTQAVFGLGQFHVGIGQGAIAVAMLIGGVGIGLVKKWLHLNTIGIWMGAMSLAVLILVAALHFSGMQGFIIFIFGFIVMLVIGTCFNIFAFSLIQEETPSHLVGKVFAMIGAIAGLLVPVGLQGIGLLFNLFTDRLNIFFLLICGVLLLVSLVVYFIFRNEERPEVKEVEHDELSMEV